MLKSLLFIFANNIGVTLSRESDGIWIYNRSLQPVFVHSPTLSDLDSRSLLVYRVSPGHCLRAFDHVKYVLQTSLMKFLLFLQNPNEINCFSTLFPNIFTHRASRDSFTWLSKIAGNEMGPIDNYSLRISFVKGWGPNYSRLEVISCPCWLEVLLSPCR